MFRSWRPPNSEHNHKHTFFRPKSFPLVLQKVRLLFHQMCQTCFHFGLYTSIICYYKSLSMDAHATGINSVCKCSHEVPCSLWLAACLRLRSAPCGGNNCHRPGFPLGGLLEWKRRCQNRIQTRLSCWMTANRAYASDTNSGERKSLWAQTLKIKKITLSIGSWRVRWGYV